jgi:undecaprenyl-diphosphatase
VEQARPENVPAPEHDAASEGMGDNAAATLRTGARVAKRSWKGLLGLFLALLLPLSVFGALAEDVWKREGIGWDEPVLRSVHGLSNPRLDQAVVLLTRIGYLWGTVPAAVLLVVWLVYRRRRRDAVFAALAVGGAATLMTILKSQFQRVRPALWVSVAPETSYSFPSGHATLNSALATTIVLLLWRTRWRWHAVVLGVAWVVTICLTRVYLGVHFPSDVTAGAAGAFAWVFGLRQILPREPQLLAKDRASQRVGRVNRVPSSVNSVDSV